MRIVMTSIGVMFEQHDSQSATLSSNSYAYSLESTLHIRFLIYTFIKLLLDGAYCASVCLTLFNEKHPSTEFQQR